MIKKWVPDPPENLKSTFLRNVNRVKEQFNINELAMICQLRESDFERFAKRFSVKQQNYWFRSTGSSVLTVCHLDSVRSESVTKVEQGDDGPLIYNPRLDDRLGAYTILKLLPRLGIHTDVLLCTDEEIGQSSAQHFTTTKKYNWGAEFDRTGSDVVSYQYDCKELDAKLSSVGFLPAAGSFSDIGELESLGCKFFNVGVAYEDYHSPNAYFVLNDYINQIAKFMLFYDLYKHEQMSHVESPNRWLRWGRGNCTYDYGEDYYGSYYKPIEPKRTKFNYELWDYVENLDYRELCKLKNAEVYDEDNLLWFSNNKEQVRSWLAGKAGTKLDMPQDAVYLAWCEEHLVDPENPEMLEFYLRNGDTA